MENTQRYISEEEYEEWLNYEVGYCPKVYLEVYAVE